MKRWGVKELLLEANSSLLNNWIASLAEEDYEIFIKELKDVEFDEAFTEKFKVVQCFKFKDNFGQVNFYGIDDLQLQENLFLINETTAQIKEIIRSMGFAVLEFNLMDYAAVLNTLETQLDYLSDTSALFNKLTADLTQLDLENEQRTTLFLLFGRFAKE